MKNIALIKSIIAASISSANTAELTEHIVALIQAHPEEIRENALAALQNSQFGLQTRLSCPAIAATIPTSRSKVSPP